MQTTHRGSEWLMQTTHGGSLPVTLPTGRTPTREPPLGGRYCAPATAESSRTLVRIPFSKWSTANRSLGECWLLSP